jgi:hypothetical protein
MLWVDNDEKYNRWLLFETNVNHLFSFFLKKKSLSQLIKQNPSWIVQFLDFDHKIDIKQVLILGRDDIPVKYLPEDEAFFDSNFYSSYALELFLRIKEQRSKPQVNQGNISTSIWKVGEISFGKNSNISKKIKQVNFNNYLGVMDENFIYSLVAVPYIIHLSLEYKESKDSSLKDRVSNLLDRLRLISINSRSMGLPRFHLDNKLYEQNNKLYSLFISNVNIKINALNSDNIRGVVDHDFFKKWTETIKSQSSHISQVLKDLDITE